MITLQESIKTLIKLKRIEPKRFVYINSKFKLRKKRDIKWNTKDYVCANCKLNLDVVVGFTDTLHICKCNYVLLPRKKSFHY